MIRKTILVQKNVSISPNQNGKPAFIFVLFLDGVLWRNGNQYAHMFCKQRLIHNVALILKNQIPKNVSKNSAVLLKLFFFGIFK